MTKELIFAKKEANEILAKEALRQLKIQTFDGLVTVDYGLTKIKITLEEKKK